MFAVGIPRVNLPTRPCAYCHKIKTPLLTVGGDDMPWCSIVCGLNHLSSLFYEPAQWEACERCHKLILAPENIFKPICDHCKESKIPH